MTTTKVFVLDTNILISAFLLSHKSITAQAYHQAKEKGQIAMSEATYEELSDVFIRPKFDKYLNLSKRLAILEDLKEIMNFVTISVPIKACRDPKDDKYLELAVSAKANYIVTGDQDLLVLHPYQQIAIITPADFLTALTT